MASGVTRISDVVVPEVFDKYLQQYTETKSRLIQSGVVQMNQALSNKLAGGGLTFDMPSWKDLDDDADNVSSDDPDTSSTPNKIGTATEIAVRLSRNQSWSSMDMTAELSGEDPMGAILGRVGDYWIRRRQDILVATVKGVFADNAAAPSGSEHVQNDLTNDVSGASFVDGVTNFTAEGFLDALVTMGDSQSGLQVVMVHSVVYNRMQKNNLIDFIPDATGQVNIPTFLGREVIVDDGLPVSSGVYESWIFGRGAVQMGTAAPDVPSEVKRNPDAGNGSGQEIFYSRQVLAMHPVGHKFVPSPSSGGPANAATTGNLAHADSWQRVYSQRKQIKIARYITREA